MTRRGSRRSSSQPTGTLAIAMLPSASEAATESCVRVSPTSSCIGTNSTGKAYASTP
jgi:hypothetical protein